MTVTLFANTGFSGASRTLSADETDFRDINMNDTVSSIRIESNSNPNDDSDAQQKAIIKY
jgi:hypothetical protein